jgi:succinyl-CoA synthetase beta subunit
MLGGTLVTKQTGAQGKPVNKLFVCEKLSLVNEMYFAIALDRKAAGPVSLYLILIAASVEFVIRVAIHVSV